MDDLLAALRAVAEPTRLRILALCADGELTVTDLTQLLDQSQPRVSRHLKILVDAGVLVRYREGTFAMFRLADRGVPADLVRSVCALLPDADAALAADRGRLAELKAERATAAESYFRANAERWDEIRSLHVDACEVERRIAALLPEDRLGDVLDLGTGTGRMLALLAPRADRLVGLDQSREMLAVARANLERAQAGDWQIRHGDIYRLPFDDDSFDLAVMHLVLHYLESPSTALAEARRVLRPDGRLLLIDYAPHGLSDLRDDHRHRWLGFEDAEIAGWFERTGFTPVKAEAVGGAPLSVRLWLGRVA
ncbi:MAG: metalloregulator ArsR/SmtB family transcription factor [Rhodospirillaceae bacterium]|nr:metalloregulator ArsR/SmtB family transcription factor [Rhodospirillaceae bacterium]